MDKETKQPSSLPGQEVKKTTINLKPKYVEILQELEEEYGLNQTTAIQLGIVMLRQFYFQKLNP